MVCSGSANNEKFLLAEQASENENRFSTRAEGFLIHLTHLLLDHLKGGDALSESESKRSKRTRGTLSTNSFQQHGGTTR